MIAPPAPSPTLQDVYRNRTAMYVVDWKAKGQRENSNSASLRSTGKTEQTSGQRFCETNTKRAALHPHHHHHQQEEVIAVANQWQAAVV